MKTSLPVIPHDPIQKRSKNVPVIVASAAVGGILVLIAVIVILMLVLGFANRRAASRSIVAVLDADKVAVQEFNVERQDRAAMMLAFQRLVDRMHAVDFSRCPEDFRVAYQRYLNACDALVREVRADPKGLGLVAEGLARFYLGGQKDGGLIAMADRLRTKADDVAAAWDDVKTAAVVHEVKFAN